MSICKLSLISIFDKNSSNFTFCPILLIFLFCCLYFFICIFVSSESSITFIFISSDIFLSCQVTFIVASPCFFAVIFPLLDTSTISLLLLSHNIFLFSIQLGDIVTSNVSDFPTSIFFVSSLNFTSSFYIFTVITFFIFEISTDVTVIFAVPLPIACIFPCLSTFATFSLLLIHFNSLFFAVVGPTVAIIFVFSPCNRFIFSLFTVIDVTTYSGNLNSK